MSQAQKNGDAVSQKTKISNNNLQVNDKSNGFSNGIKGSHKVTTLRDATQKAAGTYRIELGSSAEQYLKSCSSIEIFFDFVAGIRLREMPHPSSRWDKVLKWAEFFAAQVFGYSEEVIQFADYSHDAAQIIWAACRSLLELGPRYVAVLEKAFGLFYSCGLTLGLFLRHHELLQTSEELQLIMASCYTDLLRLVTGVSIYFCWKQTNVSFSSQSFDELFGRTVESFFINGDRFTDTIWATRLEALAKPGDVSVDLVREFLTPHDRVTRLLAVTRYVKKSRADFTCEWFDRQLSDFTRSSQNMLYVTGKPCTGKSVLSEWVVERLQASTGRRASEVITYTVDSDLKTELNTIAVVKGLLLQMLQLNVGDNTLYKSLATAYELHSKGASLTQVEDALWTALEGGLRADRYQTIVIDGIDQLKGGEGDGMRLLDRLSTITSKVSKTKCITFSRPFSKLPPDSFAHFPIETNHVNRDLAYFAESILPSLTSFKTTAGDRTTIIAKLVQRSEGSFGWLVQAFEILGNETTSESIIKRIEALPKALTELIDITISSVDLKHRDAKSILAWMLAAERPLLVAEIKQLMAIDISTCTSSPRTSRAEDVIVQTCGPLIDIRDGFVRFKSSSMKQNLYSRAISVTDFKNTGAFPFHIKEAHYDLTIRCLAYCKIYVTRPTQPTLQSLNDYELDELFNSYDLLQYSARYWAAHFQASPMHEPTVQHKITTGFKTCFPASTLLPVIEGSIYQYQYSINETIDFYLLTLSIRTLVFGDSSESVLQTLLNLARTKSLTMKSTEISKHYYDAWKLAIHLRVTKIGTICAHKYLDLTSSITTTKHTEVASRREELLLFVIQVTRESKRSTKEVLIYMEILVTLYISIGETEKAAQYSREIYEINVSIYGRTSSEAIRSYERLTTTVSKTTKTEEIYQITKTKYEESTRTLGATDGKRISLTWQMIEYYEKHKDYHRVEEVLLCFLQSLSHTRYTKDVAVQEMKIDVALRYVEFLKEQKRTIEAEALLIGLWSDLERYNDESTATITRTKRVGDQLQIIGSLAAARRVFASLWAYYLRSGKQTSSEATAVSSALTQTTQETTDSYSETIYEITTLREIFETTFVKSTTKQVDITTLKTAWTLVETYYQRQEWSEVVKVTTLILSRAWPSFVSTDLNQPLPSTYQTEIIQLLHRISFAYLKLRQLDQAEHVYRRTFYAIKATPKSSDELLFSSFETLIDYYESQSMIEETVVVYRDLALELQRRHGKSSNLKTFYTLGDISRQINDTKTAEWAYHEIHSSLGTEVCHRDAIRAALALSTIYEQQRQYTQAKGVYASLWAMFIKNGKDYDLKPDWAEDLYQKYVRVLKQENKTEYQTFYQLAVDYRKALVRFYGVSHEITLKATMRLAELSEEHTVHREDAIAMYEEADHKSRNLPKGQVTDSTLASIHAARKRLPLLYSISKLVHSPRAIELYNEELQAHHSKHGHVYAESITWLSLLTIAYTKQGSKDSTAKANHIIKSSVIEVLKGEKIAQKLYDSGASLAEVYLKAGLKTDAEQLAKQLRSQAIFGDSDLNKSLNLASGTKLDKQTWVFLVSFETTLAGKRETYSWEMANLIRAVFMYGSFTHAISQKSPFLPTLIYGSRLLQFIKEADDDTVSSRVEKELLMYFSVNLRAPSTINTSTIREFFNIVLVEVHEIDHDVSVLRAGTETVRAYVSKGKFQDVYDLALLVDHFQNFIGGYNGLEKIGLGLQLALLLGGRSKMQPDQKLRAPMLEVSSSIMKQIMTFIRVSQLNITEIPIKELNDACGLLGDQKSLDALEWILTQLWNDRHTQKTWSAVVVISIGRRLAETRFTRGHHEEAIHLLEDMCYNIRRVWGALDATTLEIHCLLSEFYTAVGNHRRAMLVHENLLRDTVSDKGEELPAAEAAQIAVQQLERLKRSYQRLGGWDKDAQIYIDLYQQLAHVFGSEDSWKKAQTQSVEKWQPKGADSLGTWTKPESFEFMATIWVGTSTLTD
ncbi:hypothetical protein D0Z07_0724 [Hyphodiscus hymeniophilus]|uniref:Nephrocystin 3-like N-terminal domain-containing protein n=1 Tax=Hyphodiscus hymeniophilus TaxID=353542 RepID=A0A9P6VRT7_9HELO|nr:hypothetical protein D0Z07_0724 [Hyphodiscus hymeniophilus]